jgi:hypothetical protein
LRRRGADKLCNHASERLNHMVEAFNCARKPQTDAPQEQPEARKLWMSSRPSRNQSGARQKEARRFWKCSNPL